MEILKKAKIELTYDLDIPLSVYPKNYRFPKRNPHIHFIVVLVIVA